MQAVRSPPLLLASGSRYRAELLARLGLPFASETPAVDETARAGEAAAALATRLAAAKARAVAARHPRAIVVGSDQVAVLDDGTRLGKPGDAAAARAQLARASGREIEFLTALHVIDGPGDREHRALDRTGVTLRRLDAAEIARYVAADRPIDCAGSVRVESLGIALFERVASEDPTALIGLPLIATARALRAAGLALP